MLPNDAAFQNFCDYMVRQWGRQNISVYGHAVRSNNSVESVHRYMFETVGRAHPNIWIFLTKILQIEHTKSVQLSRTRNGEEVRQTRRCEYRRQDERIRAAQQQFDIDSDIEIFLRSLSRIAANLVAQFDPGIYY